MTENHPHLPFPFPRHEGLFGLVAPLTAATDLAHDIQHLLRVYRWALQLAPEAGADPDLVGAAALVHDLEGTPKNSPERALGGERSARIAAPLLLSAGYSAAEIEPILAAVSTSSWSRGLPPAGPIGTVLQDADRLDAIGALGIARVFACHQQMARPGSAFCSPSDPSAEQGRPQDDARFALDHFVVKLFKLTGGMHLPSARAEAHRRHRVMEDFYREFLREIGG